MFHILQILSPPSSSRNSNSCSWPVGFSRVFSLTISDAYGGNCWDKSHSWKLWLMLHLSQTRSSRHSLALHLYHLHLHLHMLNIHWTNFQIPNCKRENPLSTCVETTFLTRVIFLRPWRLCIVSLYSQLRFELEISPLQMSTELLRGWNFSHLPKVLCYFAEFVVVVVTSPQKCPCGEARRMDGVCNSSTQYQLWSCTHPTAITSHLISI